METKAFLERWSEPVLRSSSKRESAKKSEGESGASERANKDLFLAELCDVLGLGRPEPASGDDERAEEEKRGLIRWLRPEYQQKVVKVKGAAVEPTPEPIEELALPSLAVQPPSRPSPGRGRGSDSEAPSPDDHSTTGGGTGRGRPRRAKAGSPRPPWPKTLPEQIGAVRDLVLGSERAWTAEAVARSFHRAQVKTVEPVLDSLSAIGVLVALDGAGGRQWKGAGE